MLHGVAPLKTDGKLVTDTKDKATVLNQQFSSVFTRENMSQQPELGSSPYGPIQPLKITRYGVAKQLTKIKDGKAAGPDKLPARCLKEMAEPLSGMLSFIYQQSLGSGQVPQDWRKANVALIFKKGDNGIAANYHPLSLTAIPCKILEHTVANQIMDHLDQNQIVTHCRHGF